MTGAEILIKCLEKQKVKYIFGIPGAKIDEAFDALVDSNIEVILCRHEQNAVFMAGCIGRLTGKPGVVLVTSGPGVSNLVTGLLTATTEGDPIVAIGGSVPRRMKLKEAHQAVDNIKLTEASTKDSIEIGVVETIPEVIENAFRLATAPRAGSVFISIPQDVLHEKKDIEIAEPMREIRLGRAPLDYIKEAAVLIENAHCPVLFLGHDASRENNAEALCTLLRKHSIAVVGTYQATGVIPRGLSHCAVGRVGLFKNHPADKILDHADVIITIGYNAVEYNPEIWNPVHNKKIIHIDYIPVNAHIAYEPQVELIGNIENTLITLSEHLSEQTKLKEEYFVKKLQDHVKQQLAEKCDHQSDEGLIHPLTFIHQLRAAIDDDTLVSCDIGTHYMWLARYLLSYKPRHLLFSNGQQTLGMALPWAMAAKMTYPNKQIIAVSGDGGFLYSAMELETAVRLKLNFVQFVWCDNYYNMVQEQQLIKYHRECAVKFGAIDLVAHAKSYGACGEVLDTKNDIKTILNNAANRQCPTIVQVPIDYSDNRRLFLSTYDDALD